MKVKNSTIPADSLINKHLPENYSDAFVSPSYIFITGWDMLTSMQ